MSVTRAFAVATVALCALSPAVVARTATTVESLDVVGDLNNDGMRDVVVTGYDSAATLVARSGASGAVLWTHPYSVPLAAVRVHPIALAGGAGVAVERVVYAGAGVYVVDVLDGSGALVWERQWPIAVAPGVEAMPREILVADVVAGGGDEVVVTSEAGSFAGAASAEVLDGATGVPKALLGPVPEVPLDAYPVVAGDLDGDRAADLVWPVTGATKATLRAYAGDGRTLWDSASAPFDAYGTPTPVGDVTGDGRADLTMWTTSGDRVATTLVSGRDGSVVWTHEGTETFALGDVDGDRLGDVLVTDPVGTDGINTGLMLRAYTRGGRLRYDRRVPFTQVLPAGDVNGDGVADFKAMWGGPLPYRGAKAGIVDGRTGRVLRTRKDDDEYALGASLDCRGDDTVSIAETKDATTLRFLDGRSGRTLWSRSLAPGESTLQANTTLPRPGSRCADVLLAYRAGDHVAIERLGDRGRVRWRVKMS